MIVCLLTLVTFQQQPLKVSSLFSDNMVLQREVPVPIFGTAMPGQTITVTVGEFSATAKVGDDGKWLATMPAMKAGGPFVETIRSADATVSIKNVMVGEVWLCSGQSNMERPESAAGDYAQAIDEADPAIRMFTVSKSSREAPASQVKGAWIPASKTTIGAFSAVALAFGRELHNKLGVPIGLINASWGGTKAEAWISRDALTASEALKSTLDTYLINIKDFPAKNEAYHAELKTWIASRSDKGNEGYLQGWAQPKVYETDWKPETLPAMMDTIEPQADGKRFEGAVWFRRTFELPEAWEGKALRIELGPIRDYDDTYVNGNKVGSTKDSSSDSGLANRSYRISPGIPRHGVNTIAIRIFSGQGDCGFTGFPEQMRIFPMEGEPAEPVSLSGTWMEKIERKMEATDPAPHMPLGPGSPSAPGGLFNGMIAPLIPYRVKGILWYQGESNVGQADRYKLLFPALIRDWRQKLGQAELPFYFVQLANFHARQETPGESDWADLREAQSWSLALTHTGMATTIDIGDAATIHPTNKREVGRRLSLIALAKDYGIKGNYVGPEFNRVVVGPGSIKILFKHAEDGLKTSDSKAPTGFAIAGEDHKFYWADAKIQGASVVLSSEKVPNPVAVRYGWADNPDCNLCGVDGLPAVPFRTDRWPHIKNQ